MNMTVNVYKYARGGKCVYTLRNTYAGSRERKMQVEEEFRHIRSFMRTSIGTVAEVSFKIVEKVSRNQKGDDEYRTEHETRSARNTGRKTCGEESIHTQHRLIETGKQTRRVREGDQGYYW